MECVRRSVPDPVTLANNEGTFQQLFNMSVDAMLLLDSRSFLYCNGAALEMFGVEYDEFVNLAHPADISPEFQPCGARSRELANARLQEAMREGHCRFEWVHRRSDGMEFDAEVLLSPAMWQGRSIIQAIVRDISKAKQLQRDLERALEEANQAAQAKSEFFAVMSHELRTPIHGLLGLQELLLSSELDEEQAEHVSLTIQSTKALLGTINHVLDFSKIGADKLELVQGNFSPLGVLHSLRELLAPRAREKGISLSLRACTEHVELEGDEDRLRQVLLNLIGNAVKFTSEGGVTITTSLEPDAGERVWWCVSVEDTGIGIRAEHRGRIFEKFSQADSSITRRFGGTGLGLSISEALVTLMGGSIEVDSVFGESSTFRVRVPLRLATSSTRPTGAVPVVRRRRHDGSRALVVEDNPINQRIILRQLEGLGFEVELASDGLEAVERYTHVAKERRAVHPFDVVLMDLQMPRMNGLRATGELLRLGCTAPIVALTADVLDERRLECREAGMAGWLAKPFAFGELVEVLERHVQRAVVNPG